MPDIRLGYERIDKTFALNDYYKSKCFYYKVL